MLGFAKHDTVKYMYVFIAHRDHQCDKGFPGLMSTWALVSLPLLLLP